MGGERRKYFCSSQNVDSYLIPYFPTFGGKCEIPDDKGRDALTVINLCSIVVGPKSGRSNFSSAPKCLVLFFGRNIPRLVICSSRWLVDWRFLIQSSDPLIYIFRITPPKKTRNKYFPWKFLPGKMMEQMVASSDGIVRDGELGIRCTLTEPAVQEVPAKRKGRLLTIGKKYDQQEGREVQERESVWLLSRPKNGSLSSTALLWGLRITCEDNKESRKIEKENWELLSSKFSYRNRIQGKA